MTIEAVISAGVCVAFFVGGLLVERLRVRALLNANRDKDRQLAECHSHIRDLHFMLKSHNFEQFTRMMEAAGSAAGHVPGLVREKPEPPAPRIWAKNARGRKFAVKKE